MSLSKLVAGMSAALLVVAPVAASAGTRAADSIPAVAKPTAKKIAALKTRAQPGKAKSKDDLSGERLGAGAATGLLVAGGLIVAGVIVAATDS